MSEMQNTTLDDISAVIGFSATLHLAAWFGGGNHNVYVPDNVEDGQLLVKLVGLDLAQRLSAEWGRQHIVVPSLRNYDDLVVRRQIGRMFERGFGSREIASHFRLGERRVQQICRELESVGLIPIVVPKRAAKNEGENAGENLPQIVPTKVPQKKPLRKATGARGSTRAGQNVTEHGQGAPGTVIRHQLRK